MNYHEPLKVVPSGMLGDSDYTVPVNADYDGQSQAVYAVAQPYLGYDRVLPAMVAEVGL